VEARSPGAFHDDIRYVTVGSRKVKGAAFGGGAAGTLGVLSYLPLCGDGSAEGDGITPINCAHLDGAEQVDVDAYHIGFVPGAGVPLIGTKWYGSEGVLEDWAGFLT